MTTKEARLKKGLLFRYQNFIINSDFEISVVRDKTVEMKIKIKNVSKLYSLK